MRNPEQAVDEVLSRLRDVKAPAGIEHRILLAIERRAAQPVQTIWRRMSRLMPIRVAATGAVACAGLLSAALWIATLHRTTPVPAVKEPFTAPTAHEQTPHLASSPRQTAQPSFRRAKLGLGNALNESDALALEEMRAPSQPAPPLPLTEQERLLQRVARRHDPDQIAMLNPVMRSKQELQAKVEFQEFFEPTRPAEEKPHTDSTDSTDKKGDTR